MLHYRGRVRLATPESKCTPHRVWVCDSCIILGQQEPSGTPKEYHMSRSLRLVILSVFIVVIGTAAKLGIDKMASDKFTEARKLAEDRVATDKAAVDKLTADLIADRLAVDKLAKAVVPTREEMYIDRPIHAGDTFAGMVGANGFSGGPFHVRTVPDPEAAAKLEADRKAASAKLAADDAANKAAVERRVKDELAAAKLAKATVRWRDAFGVNGEGR